MDSRDLYDDRKEYSLETGCAITAPENEISEIIEKINEAYPMVQINDKDSWCTIKVYADKLDDAFYEVNRIIENINETYPEIYIDSMQRHRSWQLKRWRMQRFLKSLG